MGGGKGRSPRRLAASLDMYAKVPSDILEGTKSGSILSYSALTALFLLFVLETSSFLSTEVVTDLSLDSNKAPRVQVNFNITMMDLKCDFVAVDVVSFLGTNQNVTQHVKKESISADGVKKRFIGRNIHQHDVVLKDEAVKETIEELHENGEDAISLDATTLVFARHEYDFLFVDFFASWCSHCQALAPTWETLAEVMDAAGQAKVNKDMKGREHEYSDEDYSAAVRLAKPVTIAKVDCVVHKPLCTEQQIMGYPTLRLFVDDKHQYDYNGPREVVEMTNWLAKKEETHRKEVDKEDHQIGEAHEIARERMNVTETRDEMNSPPKRSDDGDRGPRSVEEKEWAEKMRRYRNRMHAEWRDEEHPGCQISGFLMVDRAPGNFHIEARSLSHDLASHMTNVSHEVHHLSFGIPGIERHIAMGKTLAPIGFESTLSPMDGNVYVTHNEHEAYHHYLKVISTDVGAKGSSAAHRLSTPENRRAYRILESSQLSFYHTDQVPEAKFSYDLSPIAVSYRLSYRRWYDYITSIMAIVGGTFTVVGMMEGVVNTVTGGRHKFIPR